MRQIVHYYANQFGWQSYGGPQSDKAVEIYTQLSSIDFRENAIWVGDMEKFLVGEGGDSIFDLDNSLSVLGHEYSHAILKFSSGLLYHGQSGAINEHFADIQGATISAMLEKDGHFDFTIGSEVLRPSIKAEKQKILSLILPQLNYSSEQVRDFSLNQIGLRHLFSPALSIATQYDNLSAVRAVYPEDCQPSIDNDNCGVHSASGVPNKAVSLIIAILGLEQTRSLFFNTVTNRLGEESSFSDYLFQLYEECKDTPVIANRCEVIIASFAAVGVTHPQFWVQQPEAPQEKATALPTQDGSSTPVVKICGWVQKQENDAWEIFDDKI